MGSSFKLIKRVFVRIASFASILTSTNCVTLVHRQPIDARVDVYVYLDEFSEKERLEVVKGIMMWERATCGGVSWHIDGYIDDESVLSDRANHPKSLFAVFKKTTSHEPWVADWDSKNKSRELLGVMLGNPHQVAVVKLVMDRLAGPNFLSVVTSHEFGHVLGLGHVADQQSVMNATVNRSLTTVSTVDLDEFYAQHPEALRRSRFGR